MQLDLFASQSALRPALAAPTRSVHFALPEEVWSAFERTGVLMPLIGNDPPPPVRWLMEQMRRRVPGFSGTAPCLGFPEAADCPGLTADDMRPDGAPILWVEAEVPATRVVPISSYAWSRIIGGEYLALDALDEDLLSRGEPHTSSIEASWLRAFDLEACKRCCEEDTTMVLVDRVFRRELSHVVRVSQPREAWTA